MVGDFNNTFILRNTLTHGSNVAGVGDLNLSGVYRINDVWGIRGGYNVIFVNGLALAPNQLDFTYAANSGTALNHSGMVIFQGANVGLEARW